MVELFSNDVYKSTIVFINNPPSESSFLVSFLQSLGYHLIVSSSWHDLLNQSQQYLPDLVIVDASALFGEKIDEVFDIVEILHKLSIVTALAADKEFFESIKENVLSQFDDVILQPFSPHLLSKQMSSLIELKKLNQTYWGSEDILFEILDRVEACPGHTRRMSYFAETIADQANFSEPEAETIKRGAILHDIGKLGIQNRLLNKPNHLTEEEFNQIQKHTLIGEKICQHLADNPTLMSIIRNHHEHLDGSGYPDGLKNKKIHLFTRITSIIDAFDMLTHDRPQRMKFSTNDALQIIQKETNKGWWDKKIFTQFRQTLQDSFENGFSE